MTTDPVFTMGSVDPVAGYPYVETCRGFFPVRPGFDILAIYPAPFGIHPHVAGRRGSGADHHGGNGADMDIKMLGRSTRWGEAHPCTEQ